MRSIVGKVVWVGRTAATMFGLALVLALVFGVATTAIGATGGKFILGKANSATTVSKLTASIAGPALALVNNSTNAAATALNITVASGQAPLKVNEAAGTATGLSADELDGRDSSEFATGIDGVADHALHADTAGQATQAEDSDFLGGVSASAYQKRVSGQCDAGYSIRSVGADGSVICEQDDGGGKAPDSDKLDNLDSADFQRSNASAGGDLTGNYPNPQLANGAVRGGPGGEIEDESITSADINEHGVTSMDIRDDTIQSGDISTGGVRSAEVADGQLDIQDVSESVFTTTVDFVELPADQCRTKHAPASGFDDGDFTFVTVQTLPYDVVAHSRQVAYIDYYGGKVIPITLCNFGNDISNAGPQTFTVVVLDDGNDT